MGYLVTVIYLVRPPFWYDWAWYLIAWPWVAVVQILERMGVQPLW